MFVKKSTSLTKQSLLFATTPNKTIVCNDKGPPPHIFSVQVKSGTCYITGQWGVSSEQNKETLLQH